jgi:hypothetical protein
MKHVAFHRSRRGQLWQFLSDIQRKRANCRHPYQENNGECSRRVARVWLAPCGREGVRSRHAEDTHIKVERHPYVIGNEREVMDPTQHWFTASNRALACTGSKCNCRDAHAVPPSLSRRAGYHPCLIAPMRVLFPAATLLITANRISQQRSRTVATEAGRERFSDSPEPFDVILCYGAGEFRRTLACVSFCSPAWQSLPIAGLPPADLAGVGWVRRRLSFLPALCSGIARCRH